MPARATAANWKFTRSTILITASSASAWPSSPPADMLLIPGPVSRHMEAALRRTYDATPEPKLVITVGECGANGGEFGVSYASCGAVSNVIPVDAVSRGCPPTPLRLMRGILQAGGGVRAPA